VSEKGELGVSKGRNKCQKREFEQKSYIKLDSHFSALLPSHVLQYSTFSTFPRKIDWNRKYGRNRLILPEIGVLSEKYLDKLFQLSIVV
jgi:hypothetical protein